MTLYKSKQRVADHGEVFTPAWMVEATAAAKIIENHLGRRFVKAQVIQNVQFQLAPAPAPGPPPTP